MEYSITYRKKRNSRFARVLLKDWNAVIAWLMENGKGSYLLHIHSLADANQDKGAFLRA